MLKKSDLIADMASGCKPRQNWRVGVEHEQFVFNKQTKLPVPYEGNPGIRKLLNRMKERFYWDPIFEGENPIALKKGTMMLTLEPGGAVEYSGSPMKTLSDIEAEYSIYLDHLHNVCNELGIGIQAVGMHPDWTHDQMPQMPKSRYSIIENYYNNLPRKRNEVAIMYRSCTAQVGLDYGSEIDMVRKLRVSLALQPVVVALFANSHRFEGKNTGKASYRSYSWNRYDSDRAGILPFVFEDGMSFERYIDFLLDTPMLVTTRDGKNVDLTGRSFRKFMEGNLPEMNGECATMNDWQEHMSCVFPEVRPKHYLEMRGADSGTPEDVMALAAFWVGLLYDSDALCNAYEIIEDWSIEMHHKLREDVPHNGLETDLWSGMNMRRFAREILRIAEDGLINNPVEDGSEKYLDVLWRKLNKGTRSVYSTTQTRLRA